MRICYLSADLGIPLNGSKGASAHVRGLVRAFTALGHEVAVLTPGTGGEQWSAELDARIVPFPIAEIVAGVVAIGPPPLAWALGHVWNNVAVERALLRALEAQRPDLVYERYSPFGITAGLIAHRRGVRHLLEVHAALARQGSRSRGQALQEAVEWIEHAAFELASRILTVSGELKERLVAGGVPESKIFVVPSGVDAQLFAPDGPVRREGWEGRFVLGFVGSLRSGRGVDVLVEAFRRLAADPRYHLLVVGDGPEAKTIDTLAQEFPGRVSRVGPLPHREVPTYVRAMDLALAPAPQIESFCFSPLNVLEYMAAGRTVVAARIGPLAELIREGVTGLLVPPGDPEALAEAVRWLTADGRLRRALGSAAAGEVRRAHLWTHRAARILEIAEQAA
ncbi:MAG: glycosyltransferase family 4 protein [Gemmatimonadetes bacterium]|nr:glycosyltransferase family 4 protein [Gemmatimonadota bacterium]